MIQPFKPRKQRRIHSAYAGLFGSGDLSRELRCSIIVAHPADEVVGAGCLISKLANVTILHTTDGAPRDTQDAKAAGFKEPSEYAEARRAECLAALAIAHVPEERVVELAVPDHSAVQCLADLTKRITHFLKRSRPDIVITHPYEGGHPDHDATAFAVHAALRLLKEDGYEPPVLFEMALHPSDDFKAKLPEFLPGIKRETTTLMLDDRAQKLKKQMFACFETQRQSLEVSPVGSEKFRKPSSYDFTSPPGHGKLHYENFAWAPSQQEWQSLVRKALADLFPQPRTTH